MGNSAILYLLKDFSQNNIGLTKDELGKYFVAIPYFTKAIEHNSNELDFY